MCTSWVRIWPNPGSETLVLGDTFAFDAPHSFIRQNLVLCSMTKYISPVHTELNDRIHGLEKSSGPSRRRLYKSRYTKVPVERSALGFSSWPCSFNPSQARTRPTHHGTSQRKRKQGAFSEGGGEGAKGFSSWPCIFNPS